MNIFRSSIICILALALPAIPVVAQASDDFNKASCSLETLKGNYGGHAEGVILIQFPGFPPPPLQSIAVGLHSYDGAGNVSITYAGSIDGAIMPWGQVVAGTYTVTPDCVASVQISDPTITYHFLATIIGEGMNQEVHLMYTDFFWVVSGTLKKVAPEGCSAQTLKGAYTVFGQGFMPSAMGPAPAGHVGFFAADGRGNFDGEDNLNLAGTFKQDTYTAQYAITSDCVASVKIFTPLGEFDEVGVVTGNGKSQEYHGIFLNPGWVMAESVKKN